MDPRWREEAVRKRGGLRGPAALMARRRRFFHSALSLRENAVGSTVEY